MPNVNLLFSDFTSGELSPRLYGRTNLQKYYSGCQLLRNFLVLAHGGVTKRPGTKYVATVKDSSKPVRLIPFQFSIIQNYIIEAGDAYLRFFMDRGVIESSPSVPYEITSPWSSANLPHLYWAQSADILYVCSDTVRPKQLSRTAHTSWSITNFSPKDGPYLTQNTDSTKTITPSGTTGAITLTATGHAPFVATDVGRLVRIKHGALWGYAEITGFTSTTVVNATVRSAFGATTASADWRLGAWSDTTGWPRVCVFHDGRFWFGNTSLQPNTVWSSVSADYNNFAPSDTSGAVLDSSAISRTLDDDGVNEISWLVSGRDLRIGTSSMEWTLQKASNSSALSPTNFEVVPQSNHGALNIKPVKAQSTTLFIQRSGLKVVEYGYDFSSDGYKGAEVTLLAEHIMKSGIKEMDFVRQPNGLLYFVLNDGSLVGLTYLLDQKVFAFHKHPLGGVDVAVKSVAVIPAPGSTYDEAWLVVSRTINGSTKQFIEYITPEITPVDNQDVQNFYFVDAGLTYSGSPASVFSGLTHLEGQTVDLLIDGATHEQKVVTGGQITLNPGYTGSTVHIGLPFTSELMTMPFELAQDIQANISMEKRIHRAGIRFYNTIGGKIGYDKDSVLDELPFRSTQDIMGEVEPLYSGLYRALFPKGYDTIQQIYIKHDYPLPCTILGVVAELGIAG